ncbi:MAG: crossover junction endodeoxyribonuclease RuvC [Chloroflexi bacterium]|nr:MAG: crossover junction endodeoxyribonuclease RuvC [Chloroflexota bacterium]
MLAIGVDPGTETIGFGIVEEDGQGLLHAVDYGVIKTNKEATSEKRLQIIYNEINRIIVLHQPHAGAVEKLFFQKNVTSAIAVGQARGVILLALANAGIELAEYSPQEVKQAVTGYGAAEKKQVQFMVKTILKLDELPKPDDAADALAIAICHIHANGYRNRIAGN